MWLGWGKWMTGKSGARGGYGGHPGRVLCQQGADIGLASAVSHAERGPAAWWGLDLQESLQRLHRKRPGQVLARQVLGRVTQT